MSATHKPAVRIVVAVVLAFGCAVLLSLYAFPSAEARPGGGGRGGGGGARVNAGGKFNGPRTMSRPPMSRPPMPSQRPSVGSNPRPTPPIANAPSRPGSAIPPHPSHPIANVPPQRPDRPNPPGGGTNPPDGSGQYPPGYYPPYPPGYWPPYAGYWPPPYDDGYYVAPPPTSAPAEPPPAGEIVNTLPSDCREVGVGGGTYMLCGASWYAPRFSGNQLVYVVVPPPT
jgi:hypothetical protein